jgi:hypothetical protein
MQAQIENAPAAPAAPADELEGRWIEKAVSNLPHTYSYSNYFHAFA